MIQAQEDDQQSGIDQLVRLGADLIDGFHRCVRLQGNIHP